MWTIALALGVHLFLSSSLAKQDNRFAYTLQTALPWWVTAVSLSFLRASPSLFLARLELFAKDGAPAWWLFFGAAVWAVLVPVLMTRGWAIIKVPNDNKFNLLRYGKSLNAKLLYYFRGYFVGLCIMPMFMAMEILLFAKLLSWVFPSFAPWAMTACGGIVFAAALQARLGQLMRLDVAYSMLFLCLLAFLLLYCFFAFGWPESLELEEFKTKSHLLPYYQGRANTLMLLFYLFLQPLVLNAWDGSGGEAQRWLQFDNPTGAIASGLVPLMIGKGMELVFLIFFPWLILHLEVGETLGLSEAFAALPMILRSVLVWLLFVLFITTQTGILNYASSLMDSVLRFGSKTTQKRGSGFVMLIVSGVAFLLSAWHENVSSVYKVLLSVSVLTGFVFVLRWFWWRITALTQLTAMIGPLFLGLLEFFLTEQAHWLYALLPSSLSHFAKEVALKTTVMLPLLALTINYGKEPSDNVRLFFEQLKDERQKNSPPLLFKVATIILLICSALTFFYAGWHMVFVSVLEGLCLGFVLLIIDALVIWNFLRQFTKIQHHPSLDPS